MGGWVPEAPWKIVPGSGQSLTLTSSGTNYAFANAVGKVAGATAGPRAIAVSLAPQSTATGALVRINTAATASTDYFIKTTDPPLVIGVSPGDTVNVYTLGSSGTAYLVELTH